jgi:uncharacterized protein YecT (DUF1311 family)
MKRNLLIFLTFLFTLNAFNQDFNEIIKKLDIENKNCLDFGKSMYSCSINYYNQSDSLLNVVYKQIRSKMTVVEKENLRQEQIKWLKYRDNQFRKISNQSTQLGEGLDDKMIKNQEKANVVNDRTKFLFLNYLEKTNHSISISEIAKIIPENYSILDSVSGNLNRDEFNDYVIILKKKNEEETSNFVDDKQELRPLMLLIGQPNNKFVKVLQNDKSVLCYDCGGIMGDPYEGITIKNGYFSIEHYGGSNWRWTEIITYKYSEIENNWFLHKKGGVSFHTSDPNKMEEKTETKKDFGLIKFEDFNIYE